MTHGVKYEGWIKSIIVSLEIEQWCVPIAGLNDVSVAGKLFQRIDKLGYIH